MRSWRALLIGIILAAGAGLGLFVGCTRQISVPVDPSFTIKAQTTPTFTETNSPTNTTSSTPTNTGTPTFTPTITPTNSGGFTSTFTLTFTVTLTPTLTSTSTPSPTFTVTNTSTPSPTPTTNPYIIADFEEGSTQDVTANGFTGYWYPVVSTGASVTAVSLVPGGGCQSTGNYIEFTCMSGTTAPVYSTLQGDFVNPTGAFNINGLTGPPDSFIFCIKSPSGATTQVWFGVSDNATQSTGDTAGVYVSNITPNWQAVTVCFNHMESQGFPGGNPGHMFDPTTAESMQWKSTASGSSVDIAIDDVQFAKLGLGTCPALTPTPTQNPMVIDNFPTTSNQIVTIGTRNGYWYCYSDLGNSGTLPSAQTLGPTNYIITAPGETAASNPISIQGNGGATLNSGTIPSGTTLVWGISTCFTGNGGVSQFTSTNGAQFIMANPGNPDPYTAYFTGYLGYNCTGADFLNAYSECPFAGMGFNFINTGTGPKQTYPLTLANLGFTPNGISFWGKVDPSTSTGNWEFLLPTSDTACTSCNQANFGFAFTPSTTWTQYGNTTNFASYVQFFASGSDGALNVANAYGCEWQIGNGSGNANYGLYVDEIDFY